eukprot:TRINITY_DN7625_c0_g1_i1.p1 TRINITY_DN7625_c0_g1~~TRINITY_DN7625_c0_g1_i1.p1  ORF type:complete len:131 (-),score=23.87 TRINITY_DN7625_c0_g1_i1:289-660(-)
MIRRPPRSTHCISSAASDVYKRQVKYRECKEKIYKLLLSVVAQTGLMLHVLFIIEISYVAISDGFPIGWRNYSRRLQYLSLCSLHTPIKQNLKFCGVVNRGREGVETILECSCYIVYNSREFV